MGLSHVLQWGDCAGANGYRDPISRTVRVRVGDEAQAVKTLAHEGGHLQDLVGSVTCRGRFAIGTYIDGWNERAHPFTWTKNADDIIAHAKPSSDSKKTYNPRH